MSLKHRLLFGPLAGIVFGIGIAGGGSSPTRIPCTMFSAWLN